MENRTITFEAYEEVGMSIVYPGTCVRFSGNPEDMERLLAFAVQSGLEVSGLTDDELSKYLSMEVSV